MVKRLSDYSRRHELEQVRGNFVDPETGEVLDLAALQRVEEHFPQPWPGFRKELEARLSHNPAAILHTLAGVQPVRVSRAPTRRGLGAAHQETIRSAKRLGGGTSSVKIPLTNLSLKDLENIAGYGRDTALIDAIRERLQAHGGDGKKAFDDKQPPLRKPSKTPDKAPIIRSVKLLTTQKSGLPVRGGIANNGSMLRVDIFTKGGKFFPVPLYVSDAVKTELPNRAVIAYKPERELQRLFSVQLTWNFGSRSDAELLRIYPLHAQQGPEVRCQFVHHIFVGQPAVTMVSPRRPP